MAAIFISKSDRSSDLENEKKLSGFFESLADLFQQIADRFFPENRVMIFFEKSRSDLALRLKNSSGTGVSIADRLFSGNRSLIYFCKSLIDPDREISKRFFRKND